MDTLINGVKSLFQNLATSDHDQEAIKAPWSLHDANIALYSALIEPSNTPARPALPPEVALQILDHHTRHIMTSFISKKFSSRSPPDHFLRIPANKSPINILQFPALSAKEASQVRKIVFEFTGKDQGWSSYAAHHGKYENTWSWYEAVVRNTKVDEGQHPVEVSRFELQRNRHAGVRPETYRIEIGEDDPFVKGLREGDMIELDGCARFGGWECQVFEASIEVWGVDSLNTETEWVELCKENTLRGCWATKTEAERLWDDSDDS